MEAEMSASNATASSATTEDAKPHEEVAGQYSRLAAVVVAKRFDDLRAIFAPAFRRRVVEGVDETLHGWAREFTAPDLSYHTEIEDAESEGGIVRAWR